MTSSTGTISTGTIRVLLVDDYLPIRTEVRQLLEKTTDIQVVGEAGNGTSALYWVDQLKPDLLLLDMNLPDFSGVEVARRLRAQQNPVYILALSSYHEEGYILGVLQNGASGYVIKEEAVESLVSAIRQVVNQRQVWLSPKVAATIQQMQQAAKSKPVIVLTGREKEILKLMLQGLDDLQIAETLSTRLATVQFHQKNLYSKFRVKSRSAAIHYAQEQGISITEG